MAELDVPPELSRVLNQNRSFASLVHRAASEFGTWLGQNNLRFFIEYTDHSLEHVQETLAAANELIRPQCRGLVTPADVSTLILASLLHDCAMHLTLDGFLALVQGAYAPGVIAGFGDRPWPVLWEEFFAEARRFSARKLIAMFGDAEPVRALPLGDPQGLAGRDLMLIGEFLRRHHHRLAHEIALFGVPGPSQSRLRMGGQEETQFLVELAGVIARGHRTPIRDCFDYLRTCHGSFKDVNGAHPVFVMALLRVADTIQIKPDRAPRLLDMVRELRSPVSRFEWAAHQAIANLSTHEYPETLYVRANPPDARTYLKVKDLLEKIQQELDSAWTAIGEVYGYDEWLNQFGLTLRRVRSNLDDLRAFESQVSYVPCHAAFDIADTDVLKLLIGPLYGHSPAFGIRELLQNALDAVRELEVYRKRHPEPGSVDLTPQDGDIEISIAEERDATWWVTVSDRGIGMTVETVRNYFLKAGASLRRSEIWRKTFEDEEGRSRVLRSGRFGVGVLAAFLLGDEIYVSTRHVSESQGIEFQAQLDAESLELRRKRRPVGTTIRVRISDEVREQLLARGSSPEYSKWDWYCLEEPRVTRKVEQGSAGLEQQYVLPASQAELPPQWFRIAHPDYRDIQWTYFIEPWSSRDQLLSDQAFTRVVACNGIQVYADYRQGWQTMGRQMEMEGEDLVFARPSLSIFDPDAKLPLNLTRTDLSDDRLPFQADLYDSIVRDFIAFCLVAAPTSALADPPTAELYMPMLYPVRSLGEARLSQERANPSWFSWISTRLGASPAWDPWHLAALGASSILIVPHSRSLSGLSPFCPQVSAAASQAVLGAYVFKDTYLYFWFPTMPEVAGVESCGARLLINRRFVSSKRVRKSAQAQSMSPTKEWSNENWSLHRIGDCPKADFDFEQFARANPKPRAKHISWLIECYFETEKLAFTPSRFARAWQDLVGSPVIPFDRAERRREFSRAYKELKRHIEGWEARLAEWERDAPGQQAGR